MLHSKVSTMASNEIRRDMLIYARQNPDKFIDLANDENINLRNVAIRAVEMGVIALKEDQRTVYWNNKTKEK